MTETQRISLADRAHGDAATMSGDCRAAWLDWAGSLSREDRREFDTMSAADRFAVVAAFRSGFGQQ